MKLQPLALVLLLCSTGLTRADDWPQWRGPERNGVSRESGLLKEWPQGGPKLLWKATDLGGGYSTPSVAKGRVYLLGSEGKAEFVRALDDKNGKLLWSTQIGSVGANRGPQYPGPRSTPTVDGDLLYALASGGELACLETGSGKVHWQKDLKADFGGVPGRWAYAESPLIDGDVLVCTPGGSEATLVALHKKDGSVVWKAQVPGGDPAAYASPIIAAVGSVKQYVQFLQEGIVGVEARTGRFLWRYSKTTNRTANIPTPIFYNGFLFSASGYNAGGGLAKLEAANDGVSVSPVYQVKALNNRIGGFVRVGDYVYGTNDQALLCVDFASGKVVWQDRSVGPGAVCAADGHLYVRGQGGMVALVEATPEGYKETGRFRQPDRSEKPAWPYPVVANGRLYLRDQDVLLCYDVAASSSR